MTLRIDTTFRDFAEDMELFVVKNRGRSDVVDSGDDGARDRGVQVSEDRVKPSKRELAQQIARKSIQDDRYALSVNLRLSQG